MSTGLSRVCRYRHLDGRPCGAHPLVDDDYCFWHSPARKADLAEAQALGRARRKRESTVAAAYDLQGLSSPEDYQRVVEIGIFDTLALDNSIARNRTLGSLVQTGLRCREAGDLETRLAALEAAAGWTKPGEEDSVFDVDPLDEDEAEPGEEHLPNHSHSTSTSEP